MSDFKSKLPDFQELSHFTGKLFKDIKASVEEIISEYKKKREPIGEAPPASEATSSTPITPVSPTPVAPQNSTIASTPPIPPAPPTSTIEENKHNSIIEEIKQTTQQTPKDEPR